MERLYKDLCREYNCSIKTFLKPSGRLSGKIGNPDLMIFFTRAMSHKMIRSTENLIKGKNIAAAYSRSASMSALRSILEEYTAGKDTLYPKNC